VGRVPEARMLLMAGLMLADKTAGLQDRLSAAEAELERLRCPLLGGDTTGASQPVLTVTAWGVAPAGGEALYILVHTPYLRSHHQWSEMLPRYRRVILDKLAKTAGMEDIEDRIVSLARDLILIPSCASLPREIERSVVFAAEVGVGLAKMRCRTLNVGLTSVVRAQLLDLGQLMLIGVEVFD